MFTRRSFLQAGLVALAGCKMSRYLEIDENGVARPGGPKGRPVATPQPVILGLSKPVRGLIGQTVDALPGKTVNVIDWGTDDDDNALPVTVVISPPNTPVIPNDSAFDLMATVYYGIGGAQNQIEVDVLPGTVLTLPATFIRVDVTAGNLSTPIKISAMVCRFAINHRPAKRSLSSPGFGAGSPIRFPIPAMARSFRVYLNSLEGTAWELEVDSNVIAYYQKFAAGVNDSGDIVLPSNAMEILITPVANVGGATVVFDLF